MKQLFFILFLINFNLTAQTGEWKYVDGWVYINKQEDSTAGGAIIPKKNTNNIIYNTATIERSSSDITIDRRINNQKQTKIGTIGDEDVYFSWDERKVFRCMIARMEGNPFVNPANGKAGTPEPNSNGLLMVGLCFLLLIRNLKRKPVLYFKP